jgi:transposase
MNRSFTFSQFKSRFSDDDLCLEEIKKIRFPNGIPCSRCNRFTKHYRVAGRKAYACKYCRNQVYPLTGTIFEKSSTPLHLWLYAMFLLTHTRAEISILTLQKELGVTYKTAWRIYRSIYVLMKQNKGDLLTDKEENRIHKWIFFNKIELSVTQKKEGQA